MSNTLLIIRKLKLIVFRRVPMGMAKANGLMFLLQTLAASVICSESLSNFPKESWENKVLIIWIEITLVDSHTHKTYIVVLSLLKISIYVYIILICFEKIARVAYIKCDPQTSTWEHCMLPWAMWLCEKFIFTVTIPKRRHTIQ